MRPILPALSFPHGGVSAETLAPGRYERRRLWSAETTPVRLSPATALDAAPADHFLRYTQAEGRDFHLGEARGVLWSRTAKALAALGHGLLSEFNMGFGLGIPSETLSRDFAPSRDGWKVPSWRVARIPGLTIPFGHLAAATFGHTVLDGLLQVWLWRDALAGGDARLGHWGDLPAWLDPVLSTVGVTPDRRLRLRGPAVLLDRAGLSSALAAQGVYFPSSLSRAFFDWLRATFAIDASPEPSRLYLRRSSRLPRPILNATAVEALVEELGFTVIAPETLPFARQVRLFAGAERVISPFGSGLSLAPLLTGRRQVIEILPSSVTDAWFLRQAAVHGLDHLPLLTPSRADGAVEVDLAALRRAVTAI